MKEKSLNCNFFVKFKCFCKKELVLIIALTLAITSTFVCKPSAKSIFSAIDFHVLALLFSLMALIQGISSLGVLDALASKLIAKSKTEQSLCITLLLLVFFSSMIVTNDVALLTFVPLSLLICKKTPLNPKTLIVLETISANVGSSFTPMGNPQNLFLYAHYRLEPGIFFVATSTITIPALVLLLVCAMATCKKNALNYKHDASCKINFSKTLALYGATFVVVLCSVFRLFSAGLALVVTFAVIFLTKRALLKKIDYSLLLTFVGFFIFTSNLSDFELVANFLQKVQQKDFYAYITGILTSQVISNVPAALLLAQFAEHPLVLLLAVNVGGLGTLIASLASVISYKLYKSEEENFASTKLSRPTPSLSCEHVSLSDSTRQSQQEEMLKQVQHDSYLACFSIYNFLFLCILLIITWALYKFFIA